MCDISFETIYRSDTLFYLIFHTFGSLYVEIEIDSYVIFCSKDKLFKRGDLNAYLISFWIMTKGGEISKYVSGENFVRERKSGENLR